MWKKTEVSELKQGDIVTWNYVDELPKDADKTCVVAWIGNSVRVFNFEEKKFFEINKYSATFYRWEEEKPIVSKMTPEEYQRQAMKTESKAEFTRMERLLHASMGLSTEAGEILDAMKKHIYYDKTLDLINIKEELGDTLWYVAQAIDVLQDMEEDISWSGIMETNIEKLRKRYGEKFDREKAVNRDLDAEREILEGGHDRDKWDEQCMKCKLGNERSKCPFAYLFSTFVYCPHFESIHGKEGGHE